MAARRNFYWTRAFPAVYCEKQFAQEQETCSHIFMPSPNAQHPDRFIESAQNDRVSNAINPAQSHDRIPSGAIA
jgi:hypothetical protein